VAENQASVEEETTTDLKDLLTDQVKEISRK